MPIEKYLLALKCLNAAKSLDALDPDFHWFIFRVRHALENISDTAAQVVKDTVMEDARLLCSLDTKKSDWNDAFLMDNRSSTSHLQAALRVRQALDHSSRSLNEKDLMASLSSKEIGLEQAIAGLNLLEEWGSDESVRDDYKARARESWPEATAFQAQ